MIPPGVPTVACGSCGQAISPVVQPPPGGGAGGGAPHIQAQAQPNVNMVKCPVRRIGEGCLDEISSNIDIASRSATPHVGVIGFKVFRRTFPVN